MTEYQIHINFKNIMFQINVLLEAGFGFVSILMETRDEGKVGEVTGSAPRATLMEEFERTQTTLGNQGLHLWMKSLHLGHFTNTFS